MPLRHGVEGNATHADVHWFVLDRVRLKTTENDELRRNNDSAQTHISSIKAKATSFQTREFLP